MLKLFFFFLFRSNESSLDSRAYIVYIVSKFGYDFRWSILANGNLEYKYIILNTESELQIKQT